MPHVPTGAIRKGDCQLTTIADWHQHAPPKRDIHWKDGRSAKENARAWIEAAPDLPQDIARTLAACPDVGPLRDWRAEPEARVPIDRFRGEQPNIDLLLVAEDDQGPLVVAIEAKADEPFGRQLADEIREARATLASNPRSRKLARIEAVLRPFRLDIRQPRVAELRYQLFTAAAAAIAEAERRSSRRAVLIAHEFVTPLTSPERRERNADDLNRFLAAALGQPGGITPGNAVGPIHLEDAPAFYLGKAQTAL